MKRLIILTALAASACAGDAGTIGPAGTDGDNGEMGSDGTPGRVGDQGSQGPRGLEGPTGPAGADGTNGTDGVDGATGATGPQGSIGIQGPAGPQGIPGPQGSPGNNGATGAAGPSLYVTGNSGSILGHPVTIDRGNDIMPAFYATHSLPPATFPQGFIVASKTLSVIYYSGSSCTGTAYMSVGESSKFYKNVLYVLQYTNELWDASGVANLRSVNSADFGNACVNTSGTRSTYFATKTTFTIDLDLPWTAVTY